MHNLKDVTFLIPVRIDSEDRLYNLETIVAYLKRHFVTNIQVLEYDKERRVSLPCHERLTYRFVKTDGDFNKPKCINFMARASDTPIIFINEVDVLTEPNSYVEAVDAIRLKGRHFCYPFNGELYSIPPEHKEKVARDLSISHLDCVELDMMSDWCVGGLVAIDKSTFIECGLMNENICVWGPDDKELERRFNIFGKNIFRIKNGPMFHLPHIIRHDTEETNPYIEANNEERIKVRFMSSEDLRSYVETWKWYKLSKIHRFNTHLPVLEWLFSKYEINNVIEFGMGMGSTPFLLDRCKKLVSIEMQSQEWYENISTKFYDRKSFTPLFLEGPDKAVELFDGINDIDLVFVDGHKETRWLLTNMAMERSKIVVTHDTESKLYEYEKISVPDGWHRADIKDLHPWTTIFIKDKHIIDELLYEWEDIDIS
jgi:hypothetical protein